MRAASEHIDDVIRALYLRASKPFLFFGVLLVFYTVFRVFLSAAERDLAHVCIC